VPIRRSATNGAANTVHLPADTAVYILLDADNGMCLNEDPLLMEPQIQDINQLTLRSIFFLGADNGMCLEEDPLLMEPQIQDINQLTLRSICFWMQITVCAYTKIRYLCSRRYKTSTS
jgi:DNA polymerase III psi subunit